MSTYMKVRSLQDALLNTKSVQKRRAAGAQLQEMLCDAEVRRRLADEAVGSKRRRDQGGLQAAAVARRQALCEIWRLVVKAAAITVEDIHHGKTKITASDITMLFKLIQACDAATEGFESAYSSAKLKKEHVKLVTRVCLDLLDDKEALEVAEVQLLEMLAFICSRKEYVAYFRPQKDIQLMVEEAEKRISAEDRVVPRGTLELAAKVFENILRTSAELNISLSLLLAGTVKLIAAWCNKNMDHDSVRPIAEQSSLYSGLSAIIMSNPEQAIAPLRRHGSAILSFAKRRYGIADEAQRHVLNEYFQCHIHVCQVAGKLQGCMPGDLGDLGKASLSPRQMNSMLELVMRSTLKKDQYEMPLSDFHRTQLELTVRLFACAQRLYFCAAEWSARERLVEEMETMLHDWEDMDDYLKLDSDVVIAPQPFAPSTVAQSPFFLHILQPLYLPPPRKQGSDANRGACDPRMDESIPLLQELAGNATSGRRVDARVAVPLLQVLCAASEVYPTGACWRAAVRTDWYTIQGSDNLGLGPMAVGACSADDIAAIVCILATLLEVHGSSDGCNHVQKWTLLALAKLADACSVVITLREPGTYGKVARLGSAWRLVWSILFQSGLRYHVSTKQLLQNSVGDFVLQLVERITRHLSTDPEAFRSNSLLEKRTTFLYGRQNDIWKLPVFGEGAVLDSPSCFELIYAVLYSVGLAEDDPAPEGHRDDSVPDTFISNHRRRLRLLDFCLEALSCRLELSSIPSLSVCIAGLVNGTTPCKRDDLYEFEAALTRSSALRSRKWEHYYVSNVGRLIAAKELQANSKHPVALLLKEPPSLASLAEGTAFFDEVFCDFTVSVGLLLQESHVRYLNAIKGADYVSASSAVSLLDYFASRLHLCLSKGMIQIPGFVSEIDGGSSALSGILDLLGVKIEFIVILGSFEVRTVENRIQRVENRLLGVLEVVSDRVIDVFASEYECFIWLSHIWQILSAFVSFCENTQSHMTLGLVQGFERLHISVEKVLESYGHANFEIQVGNLPSRPATTDDDNLMDDVGPDSDDNDNLFQERMSRSSHPRTTEYSLSGAGGRKRRREQQGLSSIKRRVATARPPPNLQCTYLLASITVILNPSYDTCLLITTGFLGTSLPFSGDDVEIDTMGGILACHILSDDVVLNHRAFSSTVKNANAECRQESVAVLACQVVEAVRFSMGPDSPWYPFGYQFCSRLVRFVDRDYRASPLTNEEASLVTDILKGPCPPSRPFMRAVQLQSAICAFSAGGENFHAQIDKDFPGLFVIPSLQDENPLVRRQASSAVAAAILLMPEEKVIGSVLKRLPIVSVQPTYEGSRKEYREWYVRRDNVTGDASTATRNQFWEDACASVESGVIGCWVDIARTSKRKESQRQILFNLVQLAFLRPDLERLCFQALERVSLARGYGNVDSLIESELDFLSLRWMDAGFSLLDFPMIITAPSLVRTFLFLGTSSLPDDHEGALLERLKFTAVSEFLVRHRRMILPRILVRPATDTLRSSATREGRRRLLEDVYLKELCSVFEDHFDDEVVKKILKSHIPYVLSFAATLAVQTENDALIANELMELINATLSADVVQRQKRRHTRSAIRHTFQLIGSWGVNADALQKTLTLFSEDLDLTVNNYIWDRLKVSFMELLMVLRYRLAMGKLTCQLVARFSGIRMITQVMLRQIQTETFGKLELEFFFRALSGLLEERSMVPVRVQLLDTFNIILEAACSRSVQSSLIREQLAAVAKMLLSVAMHVHEESQGSIISQCRKWYLRREATRAWSVGLTTGRTDAWGWERSAARHDSSNWFASTLSTRLQYLDKSVLDAVVRTYDIVDLLTKHATVLKLSRDDFIGAAPPYETPESFRLIFAETNCKYSAQDLIIRFLSVVPTKEFAATLTNLASPSEVNPSLIAFSSCIASSIETRILRAELEKLETSLKHETSVAGRSLYHTGTADRIILELSNCCSYHNSIDVRLAASRCLGRIDSEVMKGNVFPVEPIISVDRAEDSLQSAIKSGKLDVYLMAGCIEILLRSLGSSNQKVSMVAMDTLVRIDSRAFVEYLGDSYLRALLDSMTHENALASYPSLLLTEKESDFLRRRASDLCGASLDGDDWCWDDLLWKCALASETKFEDWICSIVPSIIDCCYRRASEKSSSLFVLAQRVSCIDHNFATACFPLLVLTLLESSSTLDDVVEGVAADTRLGSGSSPINAKLSRCVSTFLQCVETTTEKFDTRPLDLIVNMLDYFHRLTLSRFLSSTKHKRNIVAKRKNESVRCQPERWKAVPFGVVLRLDGILVAKACIKARRFASALYYVDLYSNFRFGGRSYSASGCFVPCSPNYVSTPDISGFEGDDPGNLSSISDSEVESFFRVLKESFAGMHDDNAVNAVQRIENDFHFVKCPTTTCPFENFNGAIPSTRYLHYLERRKNLFGVLGSDMVTTTVSLGSLGLRDVAKFYIKGHDANCADVEYIHPKQKEQLREEWFKCTLYEKLWEDPLFRHERKGIVSRFCHNSVAAVMTTSRPGLFELLTHAIACMFADDLELARVQVQEARRLLVAEPFANNEGPLGKLLETMDGLKAVNIIEDALDGDLSSFSQRQCFSIEANENRTSICEVNLTATELSHCVEELVARSLHASAVRQGDESRAVDLAKVLNSLLWQVYSSYKISGCLEAASDTALRLAISLKRSSDTSAVVSSLLKLRLEEAVVMEASGDFSGAIRLVNRLIENLRERHRCKREDIVLTDSLITCGLWMARHKVEPARSVIENYMKPGAALAQSLLEEKSIDRENLRCAMTAFFSLGHLASNLLDNLSTRMRSLEWRKAGQTLDNMQSEILQMQTLLEEAKQKKKRGKHSKDAEEADKLIIQYGHHIMNCSRQVAIRQAERTRIQRSVDEYRHLAFHSIVTALSIADHGGKDNLSSHVYRLFSLWFSRQPASWTKNLSSSIEFAVDNIPSFRFVPLVSQFVSQLDDRNGITDTASQKYLRCLLAKMCRDHPHHCLLHIMYIAKGKPDSSKFKAARSLLDSLAKRDGDIVAGLIESYTALADAYVHLAMVPLGDNVRGSKIPLSNVSRSASHRLDLCLGSGARRFKYLPCIVTSPPALRPQGNYRDFTDNPMEETIGFEKHFTITASGINLPKIVICIGSRGGRYKQLVKGNDEVRQDAVMQQVFAYVNDMMAKVRDARYYKSYRHNGLRLVTYTIVPLSQMTGVLEWVENTLPFIDYIADRGRNTAIAAHSRYYPGEWGHSLCRDVLNKAEVNAKRSAFDSILACFSACFRFFFLEYFSHSMQQWYNAKMMYSRSVAMNSVVGHVLGIGDRHGSNILVHQATGKVVHIDFGIVFEQGRLLRTPETVPFRLTQNVIDGLGPLGTEGVFTKTAEETLKSLKQNTSALLTILTSIVADPLYKWTLNPLKANKRQRERGDQNDADEYQDSYSSGKVEESGMKDEDNRDTGSENEAACNALAKVHEKLQGYEDGTSGEQQSVEGQLQLLINSARDPDNLCEMFPGWAPWI